jgi:ABC-type transport system involved in cytochrome c biogenesis permease subunit
MDRAELRRWRMYGMLGTTFVNIVLVVWAVVLLVELYLGR